MVRRKDFVSNGLMNLHNKKQKKQSKENIEETNDVSSYSSMPDIDKTLSMSEGREQIYQQKKGDLDLRLHEQLAKLEDNLASTKQKIANIKSTQVSLEKIIESFAALPETKEFGENPESLSELEQLRVDFFKIQASYSRSMFKKSESTTPATRAPQLSLLPELNSLAQLQMIKMGLFFALPLIIGILAGCIILAWVIIFTWGV
jgi:hypothetical protein